MRQGRSIYKLMLPSALFALTLGACSPAPPSTGPLALATESVRPSSDSYVTHNGVDSPCVTDDSVAKLEKAMSKVSGDLVKTCSKLSFPELRNKIASSASTASKFIHTYSDGTTMGYVAYSNVRSASSPEEPMFREWKGDITIATVKELPDFLAHEDKRRAPSDSPYSTPGDGKDNGPTHPLSSKGGGFLESLIWFDGVVPYVIDIDSFKKCDEKNVVCNDSELMELETAIQHWNRAKDPQRKRIRVRFIPQYPNDNRPYVTFVRVTHPSKDNTDEEPFDGASFVGCRTPLRRAQSHEIKIARVAEPVIHHEMGHTVGMLHEQQRCDRNDFVVVQENPLVSVSDCARHCPTTSNCDQPCIVSPGAVDYGKYNYGSVMHYPYGECGMSILPKEPSSGTSEGDWKNPGGKQNNNSLGVLDVFGINQKYASQQYSVAEIREDSSYSLVPKHAKHMVLALGSKPAPKAAAVFLANPVNPAVEPLWKISVDDTGNFKIQNMRLIRGQPVCMEGSEAGAGVVVNVCAPNDSQRWLVVPKKGDPGFYTLVNKASLLSLHVKDSHPNPANFSLVEMQPHEAYEHQAFAICSDRKTCPAISASPSGPSGGSTTPSGSDTPMGSGSTP